MEKRKKEVVSVKYVCEPKPHPYCKLRKTLEYLRKGHTLEEAERLAVEDCVKEGKLHPISRIKCAIAELVAQEMVKEVSSTYEQS